jgi:protein SCO1
MFRLLTLLLAATILIACSRAPKAGTSGAKQYPVTGMVLGVNAAKDKLRVAHEEIPDFMEKMTMEFEVTDDISALAPGDIIAAKLLVTETRTMLGEIRKTGRGTVPKTPAQTGVPAIGAELPDATLTTEDGTPIRLADYRGKVLAITFIYTRCPLPDYCPRMNSNFATAMRDLRDERCHWLSVTIDPANDTLQLLAEYTKQFPARNGRWKFATGSVEEVGKLAKFAGMEIRAAGAQLDHNLRTVVIGADGKTTKVLTGNEWKPEQLAQEMKSALR